MMYTYVFRRDGINHAITTGFDRLDRIARDGEFATMCGLTVNYTFRRMVGNYPQVVVTCPTCVGMMAALLELIQAREA